MFNYVWRRSSLDINDYYLIEDRLLRALPLLVWFQQELTYPVLRAFLFDEFLYISNNMFYYIVLNQGFFLLSNVTLKFQAFFTLTGTSLLAMYTDRQLEISLLMTKNSIMCVSFFLQNNMYLHIFFLVSGNVLVETDGVIVIYSLSIKQDSKPIIIFKKSLYFLLFLHLPPQLSKSVNL